MKKDLEKQVVIIKNQFLSMYEQKERISSFEEDKKPFEMSTGPKCL